MSLNLFRRVVLGLKANQTLVNAFLFMEFILSIPLKSYFDFPKMKLFWRVRPYTMVGYLRLDNVYELAERVESAGIPGAFVECGVWKGGCSAILAYVAERTGFGRKTWLFDSFEGLPEPSPIDGKEAREYSHGRSSGKLQAIDRCVGRLQDVEALLFGKLGISQSSVVIGKGWFQDVLPEKGREIGPISLLRIDGDWYESTRCCLEHLYGCVVPGGFVIIDDYGHWEGCRRAVDDFMKANRLQIDLIPIDYAGVYFKKP